VGGVEGPALRGPGLRAAAPGPQGRYAAEHTESAEPLPQPRPVDRGWSQLFQESSEFLASERERISDGVMDGFGYDLPAGVTVESVRPTPRRGFEICFAGRAGSRLAVRLVRATYDEKAFEAAYFWKSQLTVDYQPSTDRRDFRVCVGYGDHGPWFAWDSAERGPVGFGDTGTCSFEPPAPGSATEVRLDALRLENLRIEDPPAGGSACSTERTEPGWRTTRTPAPTPPAPRGSATGTAQGHPGGQSSAGPCSRIPERAR